MSAVDVLVPYRGDGAWLSLALDSLRRQALSDWRALLVRDGADAGADALAEAAAQGDARLRLLPAQAGNAAALEFAGLCADAPLLCVLDGDDLLASDALQALADFMHTRPQLAMAYSAHARIDAQGQAIGTDPLDGLAYSPEALLLDFMTGPLRIIRREAFAAVGGYTTGFPDAPDYDLCLRLSEHGGIARLPRTLYLRRVHAASPEVLRWAEGIEDRYRAFVAAVARRGLDARYDCRLQIDSRHILTPLRPFGGWGVPWR